jgi:hypothetical protein
MRGLKNLWHYANFLILLRLFIINEHNIKKIRIKGAILMPKENKEYLITTVKIVKQDIYFYRLSSVKCLGRTLQNLGGNAKEAGENLALSLTKLAESNSNDFIGAEFIIEFPSNKVMHFELAYADVEIYQPLTGFDQIKFIEGFQNMRDKFVDKTGINMP